ncbi:glycosyltransferase family 9 protein [Dyadobacter subterraneus]|uniref:Glycosyltransferase family 9 protein n=1 Tax=Dyadobacter subterraneus TaxID=2773304 RepID=A0ABR9W7K8_9BACT|nr:glycosyltransferase family 9 protein [Dyadobacter subterraneus]MBE9460386.1 glycosyltransferase family 9 protein [Dyadobacter subterraneus]
MIPKRILVIQTAFIGDVILATSLLENLHQGFPDAQIDFLVRKGNEGLFENHPYLSNVLIWKKKEGKFKSLFQLLKQIRKTEYDWVINLQRFGSTGLLTGFSKAAKRTGFDKNPFSFLFTDKFPHQIENGVHEVTRNNALIKNEVSGAISKPKLYPSNADFDFVKPYQSKPYICIAPASVWFTKQYTKEGWVRLINKIDDQYQIFLLGGPGDNTLAENIHNQIISKDKIQNLCGKLSFLQSAALIKSSVMNFVNDSAPMHISSAVNASVTAVYCSTVPEFGFGPLSDDSHIVEVLEKLNCRPCGLHGHKACPEGHFKCAVDIKTEQFLELLP